MKNGLKTIGSIMLNEDNDKDENNSYYVEMCIKEQQLILFEQVGWKYYYDLSYTDEYDEEKSKATTNVIIYNIEDKENPVFEKKIEQSGCYKSAKVKDEYLENEIDYIGFTKIDEYLNEQTDMDERIGACRFLRSYGDGMLLGIGYDLDEESGDRKSVRLTMFDIKDPTKVKEIASIELSDCYYFAEEENAVFVSEDKNLIGICTNGPGSPACFYSISFEQGEFLINAKEEMDYTEFTRGIYIEDMVYVISREQIKAISLKDGSLIETLEFSIEY